MRQAVVIIHGIGEQRPMQTVRAFVAGALGVDQTALSQFVFSKPDRIDDTLELRRLSASPTGKGLEKSTLDEGCETDFYELYWQHLMPPPTWASLRTWVFGLLLRRDLPQRMRVVRRWLVGILAVGSAATAGLAAALYPHVEASALWRSAAATTAFSVSLAGLVAGAAGWLLKLFVADRADRIFLGYVGDAVRYLTPDPINIKARRDIRTAGLTLLRGLHEDELRRYQRIVLVGHSLGSVIAYDLITWFWQERHHRHEVVRRTGKPQAAVMVHAEAGPGDEARSPLKELADLRSPEFARSQWTLGQTLRGKPHNLPWRITDLVTLGSPLAYADVLIADNRRAFREGKKQREFPTCPPRCEDARDRGLLKRRYKDEAGLHHVRILHHGAPFAVTRWTNLYFPGDIIGGPVRHLFGRGITDVKLREPCKAFWDYLMPARSHIRYWDRSAANASGELGKALRLNDPAG